jgi:hypothetical protein
MTGMAESSTRQFRFRFGLKTLFVVTTLVAVVLGWFTVQLKWKHDRAQALQRIEANEVGFTVDALDSYLFDARRFPWPLRMLGDKPIKSIFLDADRWQPDGDLRIGTLQKLFPEASVEVISNKAKPVDN